MQAAGRVEHGVVIIFSKMLGPWSNGPAWVKGAGGDVLSTQVLPLKCKAGRLLAMIHHQSQKADILSQGQSWIPAHVDESLRLPQTSLLESVFKKSCFSS